MDLIEALKQEESKVQRQLTAVQGAIAALNGGAKTAVSSGRSSSPTVTNGRRRTMSAAVRARISRKAKARWAKIKAEQSKGKKAK